MKGQVLRRRFNKLDFHNSHHVLVENIVFQMIKIYFERLRPLLQRILNYHVNKEQFKIFVVFISHY